MFLLDKLTSLLPARLQPYAKATWPAIATSVGVGVQWIATGEFDRAELTTAISGVVGTLLTLGVPNRKPAA